MIQHLATDHATACALSPQTANCMSHLDFHSSPPVHSDKFSNSPRENIFMLSPHQAFQSHQVFKGRIQSQLPFLNTLFRISDRTAAPVSKKDGGITICLLESWTDQSAALSTPRAVQRNICPRKSLTHTPPHKSPLVKVL